MTTVTAVTAGSATAVDAGLPDIAGPAEPTVAAMTEQPGVAAPAAGPAGRPRAAVAAVAPQQSARPAVLPGSGRPVGAIAD
ncbi:hypothetical protein MSIMFB_04107 [Mycobacterium simulans]|uniref:Uncharacterized protein n=1 Tax=Mycobacterium simulans TaxID=627089 RepID=A0A7Z7IN22_9MYCO|nr:hypothetical protein MSIMFB_04107 [Mycobacterium simulans]